VGIDKDRIRAAFLAFRPFDASVRVRTPFVATAMPITDIGSRLAVRIKAGVPTVGVSVKHRDRHVFDMTGAKVSATVVDVGILRIGQESPKTALTN